MLFKGHVHVGVTFGLVVVAVAVVTVAAISNTSFEGGNNEFNYDQKHGHCGVDKHSQHQQRRFGIFSFCSEGLSFFSFDHFHDRVSVPEPVAAWCRERTDNTVVSMSCLQDPKQDQQQLQDGGREEDHRIYR
jgi:hypothetical protein